jgi:hypothetical protein
MVRNVGTLALTAAMVCILMGCTMCPEPPEDYAYGAYGGVIQRADMFNGRVGSAFSPADGTVAHGATPEATYDGPVLLEPEDAPSPPGAIPLASKEGQEEPSPAFDPGDVLASETP